ncbi:Rv3235 family protein [Nocardia brasiliensis]
MSLLPAREFAQMRGAGEQLHGHPSAGRVGCGAGAIRPQSKSRVECGAEPDPEAVLSAKEFAQWAVRLVLEVLDHRRLVTHMTSVADARIVAALRTMVNTDVIPGRGLGVAVPGRVTVRMVDARTAEVCAGYDRGPRHFALAARIVRTRGQWRLTALRVR